MNELILVAEDLLYRSVIQSTQMVKPNPKSNPLSGVSARYRAALMAFFMRRLHSRVEAEDLTQEVFVRLVRLGAESEDGFGDGMVFTIAANLLRDHHRRRKSHRAELHTYFAPEASDLLGAQDGEYAQNIDPEHIWLATESLERVLTVIDALNQRTRDIFLMFRLEGMKQREIAEVFSISVSAVEKHIAKALLRLAADEGAR